MNISLIIITKNRSESFLNCLQSIARQQIMPDQLVIVDGSTKAIDPLRSIKLSKNIKTIYITQKTGSIAAARNLGVRLARGKFVAFLDDDCIIPENFISQIAQFFNSRQDTDVIVGKIINGFPDNVFASVQHYYYDRWIVGNYSTPSLAQSIANGAMLDCEVMAAKKRVLLNFPFNTSLPFGRDEDVEAGVRMLSSGVKLWFLPSLTATHCPRTNLLALCKRNFINGYCNQYLVDKHGLYPNSRPIPSLSGQLTLTKSYLEQFSSFPKKLVFLFILIVYPLLSFSGKISYRIRHLLSN